jgi:competence protein ComEC
VVFVLLFLWLAGPRPSLLRAVLLTLLAATARASRRRTSPLNLTALAFLGMVLWNPSAIYSLSFQLSFAALIGILLAAPALSFALDGRLPRAVRLPLAAGLGAQFATAPLLAATFGIVHPIGVVATLVLAPVITLYLWAGLAAGLLHFLHVDLASHGILLVLGDLEVFIGRLVDAAGVVPGVRLSGPGTWTAMILILLAFWLSIAELRRRQAWSRLLRESDLRVLRGTVTVRSAGVARSAAP